MLSAKREMAAERIKKETDSAAAARAAAIARVERETTQMTVFKAEMEAEKIRLQQELAVAKDRAEKCKKLAEEADGRESYLHTFYRLALKTCHDTGVLLQYATPHRHTVTSSHYYVHVITHVL